MDLQFLIIYEPLSQKNLVDSLIKEMRKQTIAIDAFNLFEMRYHNSKTKGLLFFIVRLLQKWIVTRKINKKIIYHIILKKITKGVPCVDIHYFSHDYVSFLEKYEKPYKITIWGSDFYRESLYWQEKKRSVYRRAKFIQVATEEIKNDLIQYDASLADKIVVCNFGINLLPVIDKYKDCGENIVNNLGNKIIVTCGYNGSQGQQHIDIFKAIQALPQNIMAQIVLFVPITYGLNSQYEKEIRHSLNNISCNYYIFKEKLNECDLAKLRIQTDIVINIQITDALSASLTEHLYSGNILIAGNWLPYGTFDRHQIKYWQTSMQDLSTTIEYAINNIRTLKEECKDNHDKIKEFASWENVSKILYKIYYDLSLML